MDRLKSILENQATGVEGADFADEIYSRFKGLELITEQDNTTFATDIVPIIHTLITDRVISKDLLYLSLISNQQNKLIGKLLRFNDLSHIFENYVSVFNYCHSENKHWFPLLLANLDQCPFSDNILTKLYTIKLLSCGEHVDSTEFEHILQQLNVEDRFINLFISEVNYLLNIRSTFDETKGLSYFQRDLLQIYFNTDRFYEENWVNIINKLEEYETYLQDNYKIENYPNGKPSEIFLGFTIISDIFTCLKKCTNTLPVDTITGKMQHVEAKLLTIKNQNLLMELLENIYAIIFTEGKHLKETDSNSVLFCTQLEIRLITCFLRAILDKIFTRNILEKSVTDELSKLRSLDKTLTDTIWRFELVQDLVESERDILNYMFASPESLIYLCLKNDNFRKAKQVIQIFDLTDTALAKEILYTEQLNLLREDISKSFKYENILSKGELNLQPIQSNQKLPDVIDTFFKRYSENKQTLDDSLEDKYTYYKSEEDNFIDLCDLALTWSDNPENCTELWKACERYSVENSPAKCFIDKVEKLFNLVNKEQIASTFDVLLSPHHNFDVNNYLIDKETYNNISESYDTFQTLLETNKKGSLNHNHPLHRTFFTFQDLLQADDKDSVKYFLKVFNYLKEFSKIFYIEKNNSSLLAGDKEVSYFEILKVNRTDLFGRLIYEQNMQVYDFEQLFQRLQLDLLYHTAANCFPHISINFEDDNYKGIAIRKPEKHMLTYIQKRNWLLAYLIGEIHREDDDKLELHEQRLRNFLQFKSLPNNILLKSLYNDNAVVTALQHKHMNTVWNYLNTNNFLQFKVHSADFHLSSGSFETAQEISEGYLKSVNWKHCLDLMESVPERELKSRMDLRRVKDEILVNILVDGNEPDYFKYVMHIGDTSVAMNVVLAIFKTWPAGFCIEVLKSELTRAGLDDKTRRIFENWLQRILIYQEINFILNYRFWFEVEDLCKTQPEMILATILKTNKLTLLLDYLHLYPTSSHLLPSLVTVDYFLAVFTADSMSAPDITSLLAHLPQPQCADICLQLVTQLRDLDHLEYLIAYLGDCTDMDAELVNVRLSLRMLRGFNGQEQAQMWPLLHHPLLILEVLLMNTKLDLLEQILTSLYHLDSAHLPDGFVDDVDSLLRTYADRSLEMRVVVELAPRLLAQSAEHKLMQSLDSLYGSDTVSFQMPDRAPGKEDWVPNNEVLRIVECMCCQQTVFSMFNRRHHCRRCGRVVCFNCSLKRMQVPTYDNILVRVCLDCYNQSRITRHLHPAADDSSDYRASHVGTTVSRTNESTSSYRSLVCDDRVTWLLSGAPASDAIVRGEFAYEHAPSVTLCLAVMRGHRRSAEYPRFLLKQCSIMMKLLKPLSSESVHEVDHSLVIKMIKSLAIAAKLISTSISHQPGISEFERIISQADLLGLLVERGCLNLLPRSHMQGSSGDPYVDASVLRRLRDILVEREQWNFALEVSTKAGLNNTGVFAAWGKSYLKAGSLQLAREKFQRCFDKTAHYESCDFYQSIDTTDNIDNSTRMRNSSRISLMSYNSDISKAPAKNPPLLTEIIQILESNTTLVDKRILADLDMKKQLSLSTTNFNMSMSINAQNVIIPDVALCIQSKLNALQAIKDGNYGENQPSGLDRVFFDECVFYLTKYGSHLSLLEFYIKHDKVEAALRYLLDNRLSSDVFVEVYMICLRDGAARRLQECLSMLDSTLDIWKNYLRGICRHLEKQNLLNSLYQLQQFMGDYVRAAMTCIRFYKHNVGTFVELAGREHYLHKAKTHLDQDLEQDQWVEVNTVRKLSRDSPESFEEKGLTNPSLVMKVDSRNIDAYIATINNQIEIAKILASYEAGDRFVAEVLTQISTVLKSESPNSFDLPTLFGSQNEKLQICVILIVCAENIETGYALAYNIILEYKLKPIKVYCHTGKVLASFDRYDSIAQLVACLQAGGEAKGLDAAVTDMCDEMLSLAVRTLMRRKVHEGQLDGLIKLISDRATKISAYIECKQLKSAYLLAVRYNRIGDIRRILREAELLNKPDIKKLCQKIVQSHAHSPITKD